MENDYKVPATLKVPEGVTHIKDSKAVHLFTIEITENSVDIIDRTGNYLLRSARAYYGYMDYLEGKVKKDG